MKQLILFLCFVLINSLSAQSQDNYFGDFDLEDFAETIPFLKDTDEINEYLNSKNGPNNLDLDSDGFKDFLGVTIKRGDQTNERLIFVDAVLKPVRDHENVLHEQEMRICDVIIRRTGYLVEVEVYGEKAVFGEEIYLYNKFYFQRNRTSIHHYGFEYYDYYNPIYCGRFFLFLYDDYWHPYHYTWRWRYLYPGYYPYPWYYCRIIIINHYHFYEKTKVRRKMRYRHNQRRFDRRKESRVISRTLQKRHIQKSSGAVYESKIKNVRKKNPVYKDKKIIRSSPRREIKRDKSGVIIRKRIPKKVDYSKKKDYRRQIVPPSKDRDSGKRKVKPAEESRKNVKSKSRIKSGKKVTPSRTGSKKSVKSKTIKKPAETKKGKSPGSYQKPPKVKQKSSTKSRSIKKSSSGKRSSSSKTKPPAKNPNSSNKSTTKSRRR